MKNSSILAVLLPALGAAQAPLAIDPGFQLLSPSLLQLMEQHPENYQVRDIVLRPDGNYLITGYAIFPMEPLSASPGGCALIINPQGERVPSAFEGNAGRGRITELPNGQYFIHLNRFNHDGTQDLSFYTGWNGVSGTDYDYHVNADGTVLSAGDFLLPGSGRHGLIRYDSTGRLDSTFTHRRCPGPVFHLHPLRNGQFLISGPMGSFDGHPTGCVARIHPDGALDTTFSFPYASSSAGAMHELPDGRYLLGGLFHNSHIGAPDTLHLVRVLRDGSLDPSFNHRTVYRKPENRINPALTGVEVLGAIDEGRFLVGGGFTRVDGHVRVGVACVDTSGNLLHDCWASEGLRPTHYTAGNFPRFGLGNYKRLADGSHWIMGQYKGIVDDVGAYPEQVVLSRLRPLEVGMEERREGEPHLEVWPNPGSGGFTVGWDVVRHGPAQLELRDARGRLVRTVQVTSSSFTVETTDLPAGLYLLRLTHAQGVHASKWVKE